MELLKFHVPRLRCRRSISAYKGSKFVFVLSLCFFISFVCKSFESSDGDGKALRKHQGLSWCTAWRTLYMHP